MKESNYPRVIEQGRELAKALGVEVPEELQVQYGPPVSRFDQVLGAVADLLEEANAKFKSSKPPPKAKKS